MEPSRRPLPVTLRKLLADEGISQRELARRTERHGWGSTPTINLLCLGKLVPSIKALEAVAQALNVSPEVFEEYGLLKLRDSLDPNKVGMKKAIANFRRLSDSS